MISLSSLLIGLALTSSAFADVPLSYTGRLVNSNGSPVAGPVTLKIELARTDGALPPSVLCTQNISSVPLSNGVFHLKIDFTNTQCGGIPVSKVLADTPPAEAAAIRVTDITNSKVYSFQAIHAVPFASVSYYAKSLAQMGAVAGQVLSWNGTQWVPASAGGTGSVSSVATGAGLTGGPITSSGTISIATGGITAAMLAQMGASLGNTLKWNGSSWAPSPDSGITSEADPTVQGWAKNTILACTTAQTLRFDALLNSGAGGLYCSNIALGSDSITEGSTNLFYTDTRAKSASVANALADGVNDVAPSQNAVFDALALKQNTLSTSTNISVGSLQSTATLTAASGVESGARITTTVNQTATAGYTGLLLNVTETATGSGPKKLLDLQVGGVSKFSIDSNGVVSSSTATQATNANYTSAGGNQLVVGHDTTNKTTMNVDSNGFTTLTSTGTAGGFNFAGGPVGIGISSPQYPLDVNGLVGIGSRLFMGRDGSNLSWIGARGTDAEPNNVGIGMSSNATGTIGSLRFMTAGAERIRVMNDGKIGINTTVPIAALQVSSGPTMTGGYVRNLTLHSNHPSLQFKGISNSNHSGFIMYDAEAGSEAMRFRVGNTSDDAIADGREVMTLKPNGYVGIGVSGPNATLHVLRPNSGSPVIFGSGYTSNQLEMTQDGSLFHTYAGFDSRYKLSSIPLGDIGGLSASGSDFGGLFLGKDNSFSGITAGGQAVHSGLKELSFWTNNDFTAPKMFIGGFGNVGIGTNTPATKLDVNGALKTKRLAIGDVHTAINYPNIVTYVSSASSTGAVVIHSPLNRRSNIMFRIHVYGYNYTNLRNIDFTVYGYTYAGSTGNIDGTSGALYLPKLVDNGNDGYPKSAGIDANGNVAIAFGGPAQNTYFDRLTADAWVTQTSNLDADYSSGWSTEVSTTTGFGWLDKHDLVAPISMNNANVAIGSAPSSALFSVGTESEFRVNSTGAVSSASAAGQSFFTARQGGGTYAYPDGMFRAITDNVSTPGANTFFEGLAGSTIKYRVQGDGTGYFANKIGIGVLAPDPKAKLHIVGNDVGGMNVANDPNDRPTVQIEGDFPNLIIKGAGNASHTSTIGLWAVDLSNVTHQWNMGVGQNGKFSMGYYADSNNPHAGISDLGAKSVLSMIPSGNVGIGTMTPAAKLDVRSEDAGATTGDLVVDTVNSWFTIGRASSTGAKSAKFSVINRLGTPLFMVNPGQYSGASVSYFQTALGIGTTNPIAALHGVSSTGDFVLGNASNSAVGQVAKLNLNPSNDFNNPVYYNKSPAIAGILENIANNDSGLSLYSYNGTQIEAMRIAHTGFVGIGTSNPLAPLDIKGGSAANQTTPALRFSYDGSGSGDYHSIDASYNGASASFNSLGFNILNTTGDVRRVMSLMGDGNVGIGTLAPASKLHVVHAAALDPSAPATYTSQFSQGSGILAIGGDASYSYLQSFNSRPLKINNQGNDVLLNANSGNVGIRTSSPQYPLDVNGNARIAGDRIYFGSTGGSLYTGGSTGDLAFDGSYSVIFNPGNAIIFQKPLTSFGDLRAVNGAKFTSNYDLIIQPGTGHSSTIRDASGNEGIRVNPIGLVGLGVASPTERLDVLGNANVSGTVRASGTILTSDARLKQNLKPLTNSLELLSTLKGYSYDWKDKERFGERKQIGLVAQEVQKVYPQAVVKGADGFLGVSYNSLLAPVIEALKELKTLFANDHKELATLKSENARLAKENQEIKARLERIETALSKK